MGVIIYTELLKIKRASMPVSYTHLLLLRYSGTFDIYKPYFIDGKEYPAYGYFFSHLEKYVLVREANLWASDSYEHILFITCQMCIRDRQ